MVLQNEPEESVTNTSNVPRPPSNAVAAAGLSSGVGPGINTSNVPGPTPPPRRVAEYEDGCAGVEPAAARMLDVGPSPVVPALAVPPRRSGRAAALLANARWLLGVLIVVFLIRTFVGEATIIPTASMERTILVGDHVFLYKFLYGPWIPFTDWRLPALKQVKRQDIIAFRYPGDPSMIYVKRIIALAGDTLEIKRNQVYVNRQKLNEPYAVHTTPSLRENFGPITIPVNYLFVMGDNRDNSSDSRYWGPVPMNNIIGEPLLVYWSYEAPSDAWLREGAMNRARFYTSVAMNFFSKTRWSRTGLLF